MIAAEMEGVSKMWLSASEKKKILFFIFLIIIWKYVLSNKNLILEYSVVENIKLDCKWESKTRVASFEFKSTSYEFRSTSYEFKSTSYEFKFTS